jgi:hypothetical protein
VEIEDPTLAKQTEQIHTQKITTTQKQVNDDFSFSEFFNPVVYWSKIAVWTIGGIIAIIFLWKLIRYFFAFIYDVLNVRRYVWLKVMLPR